MGDWQDRVDAVWADDGFDAAEVIRRIDELAGERPADDAVAPFEGAGPRTPAGLAAQVEARYTLALVLVPR